MVFLVAADTFHDSTTVAENVKVGIGEYTTLGLACYMFANHVAGTLACSLREQGLRPKR
jgi:hypothetical protein